MYPEQLIKYIFSEESGMRKEIVVNDQKMIIQYLPGKYWEANELANNRNKNIASDSFAVFRIYFSNQKETQSLSRYTSSSKAEYLDRLQYLDGDARYDFLFKQGNDTLLPALFHYERTYDIVPFDCVNLTFPYSTNSNDEFIVEYHDNMFSFGIVKYQISSKKLSKIKNIELIANQNNP